jgi:UDP-N-acetylmuramate dehydrogenase
VGGAAALFFEIDCEESLEVATRAIVSSGVSVLTIGNGSNLLVADSGFVGLALHFSGTFSALLIDAASGRLDAGAGVAYPVLARQSVSSGLGGLEWAVGIPGSVGGGVTMNAGGHGATTQMNLVEASVVDLTRGELRRLNVGDLECSYRHTAITAHHLVVRASFQATTQGDSTASQEMVDEIVRWRREHQPGGRNCGSVFVNPPGDSAGQIIEAAGLKGLRVGGAQISTKHANFIQAEAAGSASDVRALIDLVRRRVEEETGIKLVTEMRMVGFGSS